MSYRIVLVIDSNVTELEILGLTQIPRSWSSEPTVLIIRGVNHG
jgi:hypothetical protein